MTCLSRSGAIGGTRGGGFLGRFMQLRPYLGELVGFQLLRPFRAKASVLLCTSTCTTPAPARTADTFAAGTRMCV